MTDRITDPASPPNRDWEPMTEEQISAVTVGVQPLHSAITFVEYDPAWPSLFAAENARIRRALGGRVVQLEHTGSTSVPGLAAKPIMDMTLVVADSSDEASYVPDLEAAGYVLRIREPEWYEHRLFKGPDTNVSLHTFGNTSRTTPTPRPRSSRRSSPGPAFRQGRTEVPTSGSLS